MDIHPLFCSEDSLAMATPIFLLLLENNQADADRVLKMLKSSDEEAWQITHTTQFLHALNHLNQTRFDLVLIDLPLQDIQGLEAIAQIHGTAPELPIVVLSDVEDQDIALSAIAQGAQDVLAKPSLTIAGLTRSIHYALERGKNLCQLQGEVQNRKHAEQLLRLIVEGTAAVTGSAFFQSLVRSLAEALNVGYALVSGCIDSPPTRVCTYAFWQKDGFGENVEYDLYGTPCEQVFKGQGCQYYSQSLQALFPEEKALADIQAESYAGVPLFSSNGQILGHLAVIDDKVLGNEMQNTAILEIFAARAAAEIERQQVEEALRISQEKFSKAFRASPSAITISTLKDGRYIEVNESCLQLLGYRQDEMIGSSALDLGIWVNPDAREALKQTLATQGRVTNHEIEFRKKSGEISSGLLSAEVIDFEDEPCLLAVTTDITLIKEANKALERLAEIGELASMIVHEIRNPLTTLLMGLTSFKKLELSERYQTYLELSLDEGERLKRLLNQILLYAKPQILERSSVELNAFVADMLESLQKMPAAPGKSLRWMVASTPITVLADPDKLKQIIINLVANAFEAIAAGNSVTLGVEMDTANRACILVHNAGNPIPEDMLPQLTKPFVTTKSSGTGLGLAIVKRIVEAHGGELKIESSAIAGTTVTVLLPMQVNP
jgi:PAS domain S-box-containing protein